MNKLILMLALFLLAITANAQKISERDNVIKLLKQFDNSIATKDSISLKNILTDNFIGSTPNGQSFNKYSFIEFHCNPQGRTRNVKEESTVNWNIIIAEYCAIVNRNVTYLYKNNEVKVKRLDICLKMKGKWLLASCQATEVL